jgi:hypothetical protein
MSRTMIGAAALTIAVLATACSSSNNATGTGGSSGAAGATGTAGTTGVGGTTGDAGTTGAGGSTGGSDPTGAGGSFTGTLDAGAPYAATCAATVRNRGTCMTATDVQCANTCGPNRIGYKNCNCYSDVWDCPRCEYAPGNYSCYRLPEPLEACPMDVTEAGTSLPQVGGPCTRAACSPCGSATLLAYLDSASAPKVGYCVCGNEQKWTCASTSEWPQSPPDAGS